MKYSVPLRGPVVPDPFGDQKGLISEAYIRKNLPIETLTEEDEVEFPINTPGGSVTEGFAIFNLISNLKARKTFNIEGLCASIGSLIILSGDYVEASEVVLGMIHNARSMPSFESKTADQLRQEADLLEKIDNILVAMYMKRNEERGERKLTEDEFKTMLSNETWLDAYEMKELGFVDKVNEAEMAMNIAAMANINQFLTNPDTSMKHLAKLRNLFNQATATVTPETVKTALVQALNGKKISELDDAAKASLPGTVAKSSIFAQISKEDSEKLTTAITEAIKSMTEEEMEEEEKKKQEEEEAENKANAEAIQALSTQVETIAQSVLELANAVEESNKGLRTELTNLQRGIRTAGATKLPGQGLAGQNAVAYEPKFQKHAEEMKAIRERVKAEREARMGQKAFVIR